MHANHEFRYGLQIRFNNITWPGTKKNLIWLIPLPANLEDIFTLTVKILVGINEISAICDLHASIVPKFDKLNLESYASPTQFKLHLILILN